MHYKILSIIDSLNPKDGGPSHSLFDIALSNKQNNIQHDILYIGKKQKINDLSGIKIIALNDSIFKYGISLKLIFWLYQNKNNYNLFIIHGLWQFITLLSRIIIPNKYLVFTHGMLDPYFKSEKFKSFKKKIYWNIFEKKNLQKAKFVLLNSIKEKKQINNTFVKTNGIKFKLINYGIYPKDINFKKSKLKFYSKFKFLKNYKLIVYIGRIHPKKGLDILIDAFEKIDNKRYILLIAGDINNKYAKALIQKVKNKNNSKKIIFANFLKGEIKWGAISNAASTILPSHGENFGVSIAESLLAGTPVICSNKVGTSKQIKESNAGIIVKNNKLSLYQGIMKFINLSQKQKEKLSKNSITCFNKNFNIKINHNFSDFLKKIINSNKNILN
jgi:glycosyltransferase involved in cell wall biosynthesis